MTTTITKWACPKCGYDIIDLEKGRTLEPDDQVWCPSCGALLGRFGGIDERQ